MNYQIRSYDDSTFRNLIYSADSIWKSRSQERNLAYEISSSVFSNIFDFKYVYFTNGATEFINYIASNYSIQILNNEYRYLNLFNSVSRQSGELFYMSYPFAGTGEFLDIPRDKNVVLDCSYLFASNLIQNGFMSKNVTSIIFSLSKSHNIPDERVAWVFSKEKIPCYHILQYDHNYGINKNVLPILQKIQEYPLNYLYMKYKDQLSALYNENNLKENSVNLFGLDSYGNRYPFYILKKS